MSTPYNLDGFDWFDFLAARSKMIDVFMSEGKTLADTVDTLNMTHRQAEMIFNRDRSTLLPHKLLMAPAGPPLDIEQLKDQAASWEKVWEALQTANREVLEPAGRVVPAHPRSVDTAINIVHALVRHLVESRTYSVTINCDNMTLAQITAALGDARDQPNAEYKSARNDLLASAGAMGLGPIADAMSGISPPLPAKTEYTYDDVSGALIWVKEAFGAPRAKALIEAFAGTSRMSEIAADRRSIVIEACALLMREVTP